MGVAESMLLLVELTVMDEEKGGGRREGGTECGRSCEVVDRDLASEWRGGLEKEDDEE